MKDYYKILGVEKSATEDDIKKAYRKLAHEYHPDKAHGDEKKFKEINEAYQTLSNREKRSQYDRFGRTFDGGSGGNPFGGFEFGFGFDPSNMEDMGGISDIFDSIFEGLGVKKRKTYKRGSDLEVVAEITLEEAYEGAKKPIRIKTFISCDKCSGAGHFPDAGFSTCQTCDGRGEIRETRNGFFGAFSQVKSCSKCFGTGQIPKKVCGNCYGAGRITGEKNVHVVIAKGISDGQIIKVAGGGEAGERGASPGDLYVRVRVRPHHAFQRVGDDLIIKKEMSIADALIGEPVAIHSISGKKVEFAVPENFNLKNKIKISGEGMSKLGGYGRGDLYIDLELKTPKKLSAHAKKLLEDLKKEMD